MVIQYKQDKQTAEQVRIKEAEIEAAPKSVHCQTQQDTARHDHSTMANIKAKTHKVQTQTVSVKPKKHSIGETVILFII